jgi:hypothetical protein
MGIIYLNSDEVNYGNLSVMDPVSKPTKRDFRERARAYGMTVTNHMIDRYERRGFIHKPVLVGSGYRRGVRGEYPPEDLRTVVALPVALRYCHRSLDHAAIGAWALHAAPIPWATVQTSLSRIVRKPLAEALQSPERAVTFLLRGWVGRTLIPGRGTAKKARTRKVMHEFLGDPSTRAPASTILGLVEGIIPKFGMDPSAVPGDLIAYDPAIGEWISVLGRFFTLPGIMESVQTATEEDAETVRPMIMWTIVALFAVRNLLEKKSDPPGTREVLEFAYTSTPMTVALLLHIKKAMPPAMWQTFLKLPGLFRPFVPRGAEAIVRDFPFHRRKKARAVGKRSAPA